MRYQKIGNEFVYKIEQYKKQNKRLPDKLSDIGVEEGMGEGPYYERKDSFEYILFFNIGFDNDAKTYYSKTKKWKDER